MLQLYRSVRAFVGNRLCYFLGCTKNLGIICIFLRIYVVQFLVKVLKFILLAIVPLIGRYRYLARNLL